MDFDGQVHAIFEALDKTIKANGGSGLKDLVFVALDLSCDRWRSINGTIGVTSLVTDGQHPRPLPVGVVEGLVQASQNGLVQPGKELKVGDPVRVLSGPFADLVGELIRIDGASRVRVLLQLLGGVVPTSIDRSDLMPTRAA